MTSSSRADGGDGLEESERLALDYADLWVRLAGGSDVF
jgi:hypothetical protein